MKGITFKRICKDVAVNKLGRIGHMVCENGTEFGIFFRNPIQKICASYDDYYGGNQADAYEMVERYKKSKLYRFFQNLIGNRNAFRVMTNEIENGYDYDVCGRMVNEFCSPIYFKREYRLSTAKMDTTSPFKSLKSYGFERYKEEVAGGCEIEKTTIKKRSGGTIKVIKNDSFHYTYAHVVEDELMRA